MNRDYWQEPFRSLAVPSCFTCIHKFKGRDGCIAFPTGIPEEIATGRHKHEIPFPGDDGVLYMSIEEEAARLAENPEEDLEEEEES